jgi:tRNA threonylcarbamoyladenosine modification (KEOPS) complex Cgi121 subunit
LRIFARAYLCGPRSRPEEMKRKLAAANPGSMVQTVRGDAAKNEFVFEMLAAQTLQAEATGNMLAKKPEIDFLLRIAGSTQISEAIRALAAREGEPFLLVAAGKSEISGVPELKRFELPKRSLSRGELAVVERGALLSARRP